MSPAESPRLLRQRQPRHVDLAAIVRRGYGGPQTHLPVIPFTTRIVVLNRVHCVRRLAAGRTHCRCFTTHVPWCRLDQSE